MLRQQAITHTSHRIRVIHHTNRRTQATPHTNRRTHIVRLILDMGMAALIIILPIKILSHTCKATIMVVN